MEFSRDRGRTAAIRNARRVCGAGKMRTRSSWPTTTVAGSRRTGTSSVPRTAATGSGSATTPGTGSEGEPTPGGAIRSGEPRTSTMWSADEPTTAATGSESEAEFPTHLAGQTTAHRLRSLDGTRPGRSFEAVGVEQRLLELLTLEIAHFGERRVATTLPDAAAQRGARHRRSLDRAGYGAGRVGRRARKECGPTGVTAKGATKRRLPCLKPSHFTTDSTSTPPSPCAWKCWRFTAAP